MSGWKEILYHRLSDIKAVYNFTGERLIKRTAKKKRVAFLCQYIPAWNKTQPVYEVLRKDARFEVFLICIPSGIQDQKLTDPDTEGNDTFEYFVQHGYEAINALTGKNQWLDLKELKLDYIFYARPYNFYMPQPYVSSRVSRYTKICCLVYAMSMTKPIQEVVLNRDFFRNVYCYFAESAYAAQVNRHHHRIMHKLGLMKTVFFGMPALTQILAAKEETNEVWSFSKNKFRVMWTPRWTTEPELGGTNFFLYKDVLLAYAEEQKDMDFLFRPHPLMFENFIRTGEMTGEEIEAYQNKVEKLPNVSFDREQEYGATFWNSSVLVSDISGILPEYFITGKPLIYCASNMVLEPTDMSLRMFEGCYVVYTPEELFACLKELKSGRDRLAGKRREIARELFGDIENASRRIAEELVRKR